MKFRKKKKPPQEIDINGQAERIRRYGNPTVNLFITLGIIIILALSIFLSVKKHPNNDKALERAQYYPYKVSYYADLNITELSKFHSNGKYIKLFLEGYGESFSIGRWHSEKGINNFIIAPVINERIAPD